MARLFRPLAVFAFLGVAVVDGAFLVAACSSSSTGFSADAGAGEGSAPGDGATDGGGGDTGMPKPDSGKMGNCTVVTGACDLVLQNCPPDKNGQPQECVVTGSGTSNSTSCVGVTASEQLPMGHACCPSNTSNPCLPGLTCSGGGACVDGGPQTGRCSPTCCMGDDTSCGKSVPEGIAGACDLTVVDQNNNPLYNVCSYQIPCKPFGVESCPPGQACEIQDSTGAAGCIFTNDLDAGSTCNFANDCADGLICANSGDAGTCIFECLVPGSVSPFDASISQAPAGQGGCPGGSAKCDITFDPKSAPAWLGACSN
jgi:hypothetical protein